MTHIRLQVSNKQTTHISAPLSKEIKFKIKCRERDTLQLTSSVVSLDLTKNNFKYTTACKQLKNEVFTNQIHTRACAHTQK